MVVDGKENTAVLKAGHADVNCRFTAIAADLQTGTQATGFEGDFVKAATLLFMQKPLCS
jgi:hypothetical protein